MIGDGFGPVWGPLFLAEVDAAREAQREGRAYVGRCFAFRPRRCAGLVTRGFLPSHRRERACGATRRAGEVCGAQPHESFAQTMLHPLAAEWFMRPDLEVRELCRVYVVLFNRTLIRGHLLVLIDEHHAHLKLCEPWFAAWVEDRRASFAGTWQRAVLVEKPLRS